MVVAPQKIHPPRTHECDLIWKRLFANIIKDLKTIIPDYVNGPKSIDKCPNKTKTRTKLEEKAM